MQNKAAYYTIYKITNVINQKIYIGKHQTADINDNYMGSGKILGYAISKYGIKNFTKEILHVFDNEAEMNAKEAELVTAEFVLRETNYNLCVGGQGGFSHINLTGLRNGFETTLVDPTILDAVIKAGERGRQRQDMLQQTDISWNEHKREKCQAVLIQRIKENGPLWSGRTHTDETKHQIGGKNSVHQTGSGNSQFGTRWIHSLVEQKSKKIPKEVELPVGWLEGRKIKF